MSRREGISTTSLIDRILYPERLSDLHKADDARLRALLTLFSDSCVPRLPIVEFRSLLADVNCLFLSAESVEDKTIVVYIEGCWDCFCAAHVDVLQRARESAKASLSSDQPEVNVKLVVGVDDDKSVKERLGEPSLFLQSERALDVAQCRFVDAIVMKSGPDLPPDTLLALGVQVVVCWDGQTRPNNISQGKGLAYIELPDGKDSNGPRFYTPKKLRDRLQSNLAAYEERQSRKASRT